MPIIEINKKDFEELVNKKYSVKQLNDLFEFTKVKIDKVAKDKDTLTLEIKDSNRPDLLSVEGIAREIRKEKRSYKAEKSDFQVNVSRKVKQVRPYTVCAVVHGLKFTKNFIKQMIQLQEKLCEGFGHKRREIALGIYDFDKIKWPITYTTYKPEALKFVPLGFVEEMTLKEILTKHEKGKEYAKLLEHAKEYPVFIDADNHVLSMPPIINSEYSGKITQETRNVFIEVSGFSIEKISQALNIVVTAFADRGGKIFSVTINDAKKFITPIMQNKTKKITVDEINLKLGTSFKKTEISRLLEKAKYNVTKIDNNEIMLEVPFYRTDILHNVDIIEDIAIAYGFRNLVPKELKIATIGSLLSNNLQVAELLVGLGFQEIITTVLTNEDDLLRKMNQVSKEKEKDIVNILNPISGTYNCLRTWLLPLSLNFLSQNTTKEMPQKIFEIGKTAVVDEKQETRTKEQEKLCVVITHTKTNFTEIKQVLDYISEQLGWNIIIKPCEHRSFISGRVAEIIKLENKKEKKIGIIGEISPQVLVNWNLKTPVVAMELELTAQPK